ncbi:MAG TPA: dTDP-4-dehydrorhamnose reductase [Gammaproteobacteria bacterium]|nr:dTDP-4-dehydrorhamnose reductase [Gammaproteobacteria bacterium]
MSAARKTILVIGAGGQVGWELQRALAPLGAVLAVGQQTAPHAVDLADPDSIARLVRAVRPSVVVNAGGYTAVDRAEQEPERAMAINGVAPGVLAEETHAQGGVFVHYSTDYVFDGENPEPYSEEDAPAPLNVYGASKLEGERAVDAVGGRYLILRTSWVYGLRGSNFLLTVLRLAREREELRIVDDQIGAPTWSRLLAEVTAVLLGRVMSQPAILDEAAGLYHVTAAGRTSWHGFAQRILAEASLGKDARFKTLHAIPTHDYPTPAARPHNSLLSNAKLADEFGIQLPPWDAALSLCLADLEAMSGGRN